MKMQNDIVSENPQSTVVAQYERTTPHAEAYQSEAELEQGMIAHPSSGERTGNSPNR